MRIVIKIGTSLLTDAKNQLDRVFLREFADAVTALHRDGHELVIVTSGAVAAGRSELRFDREKKRIPFRQALAAIGQGILMEQYRDFFKKCGICVAQALLTNYDFVNRENFLNTKNVFELLLQKRVIPIVNENDVTTIAELKFMDNDMLSAKTAALVSADFLFILTDVEGLFAQDPKQNPNAKIITVVEKVTDSVRALAGGARSRKSLGGMITKLEAAAYVMSVGIGMFIAHGRQRNILQKLAKRAQILPAQLGATRVSEDAAPICTYFPASIKRTKNPKMWLRPKIQKNAWIEIDGGALRALKEMGKSLLPSGVSAIHGNFKRGDVVMIKSGGVDVAYGQINYEAADMGKIKKHKSDEIEKILGFSFEDEVMHRDRMVIL